MNRQSSLHYTGVCTLLSPCLTTLFAASSITLLPAQSIRLHAAKSFFTYMCRWARVEPDLVDVTNNPAAMWWLQHNGDGETVLLKDSQRAKLLPLLCLRRVGAWIAVDGV